MATLIFNCEHKYSNEINYPRIEIFHGNDVEIKAWKHNRYKNDIFGRDCVNYLEKDSKYEDEIVPEWNEIVKGNWPTNLAIDTWEYEAVDKDSEEAYKPICINRNFIHKDKNTNDFEKLLTTIFHIPSFDEMIKIVEKTNITRFVIRNNVDIFITRVASNINSFIAYDVLTTSVPHVDEIRVPWTRRFDYPWSRICKGDHKKYAKEIKLGVLNGDDGLHIIGWFGSIDDAYPMDNDISEKWLNCETVDYSVPYKVPERVKEERKAIEERKERERRETELNKMKDGYCDRCGSRPAQYIKDPFKGIVGWLCPSCYRDEYDM